MEVEEGILNSIWDAEWFRHPLHSPRSYNDIITGYCSLVLITQLIVLDYLVPHDLSV